MRFADMADDTLIGHAQTTWVYHKLAKDYESDPFLPSHRRQYWRKERRNAGRRLGRIIDHLERRGIEWRPWRTMHSDTQSYTG